jgi:hypothetical protein
MTTASGFILRHNTLQYKNEKERKTVNMFIANSARITFFSVLLKY